MKTTIAVLASLLALARLEATTHAQPASPAAEPSASPASSGCSKDTDCKGDRVCDAGVCKAPAALSAPVSQAPSCSKDADCPGMLVCTNAVCAEQSTSAATPPMTSQPPPRAPDNFGANPPSVSMAAASNDASISTAAPTNSAVVAPTVEARRSGYAGSFCALIGLQAWDASGSPGGYPVPEASGFSYAFMETSAIGGYVGHGDDTDYSLMLVEDYNRDGDSASYGLLGLGIRGTGKNSNTSVQAAAGFSWTLFPDATSLVGFGSSLQVFVGSRSSNGGLALAAEIDVQPAAVGTDITFTAGVGGGFAR